ncbi:MAG: cysteine desulfurase [Bdellovibrionales bacterium]|nr:cysteine desulfurase [Bdellovibrionales bacterium]
MKAAENLNDRVIFLDHHSTTPLDPEALQAMMPYLTTEFGNPSSRAHSLGWKAEFAVEKAREQVAELLGCLAQEIVFTSGATESNNMAILGLAERAGSGHIITGQTEHKCVLETVRYLEGKGFTATYLPVDRTGRVNVRDLEEAIRPDTFLASLMTANNETGSLHPIRDLGAVCRKRGVYFHTDAAQAVGKIPVDVESMQIDLLSFSAHKSHGPKGTGVLYVRRKNPRVELPPLFHGGGQEFGLRPGTVNVPGAVGTGFVCARARRHLEDDAAHVGKLRDLLERELRQRIPDLELNGHPTERLPQSLNVSFPFVESDSLVASMRNIAVSSASACVTAASEPSHVLRAMHVPERLVHGSIRFGIGRFNTEEEIRYTAAKVADNVERLRRSSPLWQMRENHD